ncbi:spermidine/putrescine transport system ATP-binding protein [Anaerobranca californiensis DSM 14826]|jgi:spermidine/putrescine transport system ATP-binding protein|uniref:Spermidine/putrescine import ATP-binding protein PotA n=1 Tax=Anaerobranca californiensis DSM 14826 TaxID=1120989 RepID=A0A1M6MWF8_9FIRM|nr:spermidine/putrescine ABC transporter ATP-binding protein [Anaerobranca californiensis]SHJ87766.1 spermidine/putrescine transport system ATP-binding protein [Anaerobranca californiensis DSM 14826]
MNNPLINLVNISKSYGDHTVIENLNLYIKENEFLTLLGPSGCGKTTILRMIGGFENPTKGDIFFLNQRINDLPPYKRQINTVFQKYALFPHLNVFENIAFGLKIKKLPKKTIEEKVKQMLAIVGLEGLEKRDVESLSGGQQQRIAIARSLVNEPKVLLLDEPLGALDLKLRKEMQIELKNMQKKLGITFVYVTHDQEEALTMSDTIVVMDKGKIQQIGTPTDIYNEPKNAFVADFIGESNIISGIMHNDYDVSFGGNRFKCIDKGFRENEEVDVVVRPEDIQIVKEQEGMLQGVVQSVIFKGVHYEMEVDSNGYSWKIHSTDMVPVGNRVGINIGPEAIHIMGKKR